MKAKTPPRVAILGAGPIGLEAALYAQALGWPVALHERGQPGENVRAWGHVKLFTPFGMNVSPLGRAALKGDAPKTALPADDAILTGRGHHDAYLAPLAAHLGDAVHPKTTVVQVGRKGHLKEEGGPGRAKQPFRLLLRGADNRERMEEADLVLDCTGTYGNHRHLGDGGIPAAGELAARPHIASGLDDILGAKAADYADRTTVVIGSGHTAATSVSLLAQLATKHPGTWIVWLSRNLGSTPLKRIVNDPLRERDALAARANMLATRGEGHVEYHPSSVIESVEHRGKDGFKVVATCAGTRREWEPDRVIANVGYEPDRRLYRELQVQEDASTFAPAGLRHPEPGFLILGSKAKGRQSQFLLKEGIEQVREAFALLAGQPGLDLYKTPR
ncbi:MAG: FAD-dependent oxidoreductase [Gemmataceae bacterium]|nr:FAD-dependent oxidoreductase [Gemmataceae bacterium]